MIRRARQVLVASALFLGATLAQAADWKQQAGSTLRFAGTQQGERFDGGFQRFQSTIRFDPAALADASFDVDIDITSADTANSERDETLLGDDFFDSARFPRARFTTTTFRQLAPGKFEADARLTIRDRTVALKFPFTWQGDAKSATLDARVTLDRLAYDVGTGEWEDESSVGHDVDVIVHLVLAR
jgi:polyisoprenoid-binding protein YceI